MKVLVVNCGSSSLKYQILDMRDETILAKGLVERIGIEGSVLQHEKTGNGKISIEKTMKNHTEAISLVLEVLIDETNGVIKDMSEISAVGHRVLHGGEKFTGSHLITDDVEAGIDECCVLGPLHNPPNLMGIRACKQLMPNTPMVAVFDTAFHQTMPPVSYTYAIPHEYYEKYKVRRYGFHGTSFRYVSQRTLEFLGMKAEGSKLVICHLGNGSSMAAVKDGKCLDTTMGLTPLEGLAMGTRSGDIDPAIMKYVMEKENLNIGEMENILQKKSGVLGISGISSDFRDIENAANAGNERAHLALDVFAHREKKYIGAFAAEMNGLDALVFTAGIGENSASMRKSICENLEYLGIKIDDNKNNIRGKDAVVSADDSKVKVLVIPTNEELMIARDTVRISSSL
ncbi:MAG: acetate kinase [Clostridiales bacterium]|nr:acetate kinase [Clostridiales bacterium]